MQNFKKILVVFILLFFVLSSKSFAEKVTKVTSEGNERVSLETIIIFGDIKIGENYESSDINLLIKKLYETNFFSDIIVELKNGILNIQVEENPIINSVTFEGEKAKKYKEAISEILTLREKSSFIKNYVKTDINKIKEFYRSLGFYFIKIEAEVEALDRNRVNLVYTLDKGNKAKISKIYFLGDKKIREKKLRDIITSQEAKFWKFISRNVYLNKGRIELDKRLLKNYYKNNGYYEVEVTSSNVEYSEGEGFVLTYVINAGTRYKFKKIFADVSDSLDKNAFISLEKDFNDVIGQYYSQRKLTSILEKIDKLSEQKELQFINHRVSETLDESGVDVKIEIFEGQKFIIERINIVGNNVTNDSVIRGELIVDEGDPFSPLLVNKSINEIKGRGIFGKVAHKILEGSSPDLKVLEIQVEEQATGEIAAGAGIGTDGTSFMFHVKENNWLGQGKRLDSGLNISEQSVSGSISVTDPNYNFSGNSLYSSLNISSTDKGSDSGYTSSKTGFLLGTEFEQYEDIYLAPTVTLSFEDIEVDSDATAKLKKMAGNYENLDFKYGITFDKRNQTFQPTDGYIVKFNQTLPVLMDKSSILNSVSHSTYHSFSEDVIGSLKFFARSIHGVQDEDTRLTSRLFVPRKRLRGFDTRRVGPRDGTDWVGGNYTAGVGFEAQLPNLLPDSTRTEVSIFLDTANVWGVDYDGSVDESNSLRSAVGISANVYTTIGPLSFTLAQDITKETDDVTETFNFRLGTSF